MPSLRQLRYFLAVAEHGGFTPAAQSLFVAQPALSRQIALLEEEIGFPLFVREARGVRLTAGGQQLRERVAQLESALGTAIEDSRQVSRGEAGVLRLLHSSSLPLRRLLPALQAFSQATPGARVDIDRLSSEAQLQEIAEAKADIGFIRLPVLRRADDLQLIPLRSERLLVALPPGHPLQERPSLHLAELADAPFVSAVHRERGGLARCVTDLCLQRGFVPRLAAAISRKTSMLDLVAAGLGVAVIPAGMQMLAAPGVRCLPLADEDAYAGAAIVLPRQPLPLAARFADYAAQALNQGPGDPPATARQAASITASCTP